MIGYKDSTRKIQENQTIELENDIFDCFIEACEKADQPNIDLLNAFSVTKEKGFL